MGRKKIYTVEDAKALKSLRNKRAYYVKHGAAMVNELNVLNTFINDYIDAKTNVYVFHLSDVRGDMSNREVYPLVQSGDITDDDKYYHQDFRYVLLENNQRATAVRLSELKQLPLSDLDKISLDVKASKKAKRRVDRINLMLNEYNTKIKDIDDKIRSILI